MIDIEKIIHQSEIAIADVVELLSIKCYSEAYFRLMYLAHRRARELYGNKGYIFAQIGLNAEPCSVDCAFCSMACSHYSLDERYVKTSDEMKADIERVIASKAVSDLFLMTTADYPIDQFLARGREVRKMLPPKMNLVANIGDFDDVTARELVSCGFSGAYHIVRLGEGVDTTASVEQREQTIEAIGKAGMQLYYCVEPIGPEHTPEQIASEILRARALKIDMMAVMRRVTTLGAPTAKWGEISIPELCKIAAITALVVKPARSMNVHEFSPMAFVCGVNQVYAEIGANPRDKRAATESSRGLSIEQIKEMFPHYQLNLNY